MRLYSLVFAIGLAATMAVACSSDSGSSSDDESDVRARVPDRGTPGGRPVGGGRDDVGSTPAPPQGDAGDSGESGDLGVDEGGGADVNEGNRDDVGPSIDAGRTDADPDIPRDDLECEVAPRDCEPGPDNECCVATCGDDGECATAAGPCADICEPDLLTTGRACGGCGDSLAEGACAGGEVRRCDGAFHELCEEVRCGGQSYHCTNDGDVWQWRTARACDDGLECTFGDVCVDGACAGTLYSCGDRSCPPDRCEGGVFIDVVTACGTKCDGEGGCGDCECREAPTACGVGAGNVCCVASCDPVAGCATSAGSCASRDVCSDANVLRAASQCVGCGGAGGVGVCSEPVAFTCDATTHDPCARRTCGGGEFVCTDAGGQWAWRAAATVCGDGVCNCGESSSTCPSDCPVLVPPNACTNGSQSRVGCGSSRTISRGSAAAGWSSGEQDTCAGADRNRHEGDCGAGIWDMGNDHSYALFVRAGEQVTAVMSTASTRRCASDEDYRGRLKFKFSADVTSGGATSCPALIGCWSLGLFRGSSTPYTREFAATQDGWLHIIVDGGSTGLQEHRGRYALQVTLRNCVDGACDC